MKLTFPDYFFFGTSTAAAQIETAAGHDWAGFVARDGAIFTETTRHEYHRKEDAELIADLAPHYRMGLQWSKLQPEPFAPFNPFVVAEYLEFMEDLKSRKVTLMMVLHHFTNPIWFAKLGGWEQESNIPAFLDYSKKVIDHFGHLISYWNTFNEPNVYASYGWITAFFPPHKNNPMLAAQVVKNMGKAHLECYRMIKAAYPDSPVGISHNATIFHPENFLGWFPSRMADAWFNEFVPNHFLPADFFGMSYYGRIPQDPFPITALETPDKMRALGRASDDIWEYYPEGLYLLLKRYADKYQLPIIITENGVCDETDLLRIQCIRDYPAIIHRAIRDGIDIRGYYHWSTWDNFEWHLGPSMNFGLYSVDPITYSRLPKPSSFLFRSLAHTNTCNS